MIFYLLPLAVAAFAIVVGYRLSVGGMSVLGLPVMSLGIVIPLFIVTVHQYNAGGFRCR